MRLPWPLSDAIRERRAFDEFEHECLRAIGVLEAIDCGDVRVIERGQNFSLPLEARKPVGITGECRGQHL